MPFARLRRTVYVSFGSRVRSPTMVTFTVAVRWPAAKFTVVRSDRTSDGIRAVPAAASASTLTDAVGAFDSVMVNVATFVPVLPS